MCNLGARTETWCIRHALLSLVLILIWTCPSGAQIYNVTALEGSDYIYGYAINEHGWVTGFGEDPEDEYIKWFLYRNTLMEFLLDSHMPMFSHSDLNDNLCVTVVGIQLHLDYPYGFIYNDSIGVEIFTWDVLPVKPYSVNNYDQIAGTEGLNPFYRPIVIEDEVITYLPTLTEEDTFGEAYDINNAGQIVGYVRDPNNPSSTVGVIWEKQNDQWTIQTPDMLCNPQTQTPAYAHDINDNGQVLGTSGVNAVYFENGAHNIIMSDEPGSSVSHINNHGFIVGGDQSGGRIWELGVHQQQNLARLF